MELEFRNRNLRQRLATDADEVELAALRYASSTIDSGIEDERIASAMDDFSSNGSEPDWIERDLSNDSASSGIQRTLRERADLLGDSYPFRLDGNALITKENPQLTYRFCLAISQQDNITQGPFTELPRTFERLAMEYVSHHLGSYGRSFHTGWPRSEGAPTNFKALAEAIHADAGEWEWRPQSGLTDNDSNHIKDGGIDFIAWLQAPDQREGSQFMLGQCACGNDWTSKDKDVDLEVLNMWFGRATWVTPIKAFCIPYTMSDGYLFEFCRTAGLIYDRLRLSKLAEQAEAGLSDPITEAMQRCIDLVIG